MMLKETERNVGARGIGKSVVPKENCTPPTLSELGIDRKISSLSQRIADLTNELTIAGRFCKVLQNLFI